MRFKHFKPSKLTEQQLDELRINPTTLQQFAKSDEAKGIQAGFEAELVFTGIGEPEYDEDPEPDYDADERCRSIDQVVEFFSNDEYGYATYGRDLTALQDGLDEKYYEWYDEKMYDEFRGEAEDLIRKIWLEENSMEERVHAMLVDGMELSDKEADRIQAVGEQAPTFTSTVDQNAYIEKNPDYKIYLEAVEGAEEILEEEVEKSIADQDKYYDSALDDFRDGFYIDDDSGFFGDVGWRWMSDIAEEFSLMWPVMTYTGSSGGGFNQDAAERLADDLSERLGIQTKVSGGYHSATRKPGLWIFEPDSSLEADDSDNMPVEIVSPPMPLEECLRMMEDFFTWAEDNGAYANSSTGFHMGVSLPHRGGDVDYVKLALFLGDQHVLEEFGRAGNHFCDAAIKKIKNRVRGNKEAVSNALELMKSNLIELAQKALEINNHGFGKYTSINPQGGNDSTKPHLAKGAKYIEFRSAGGTNYFEDIDKLKNTLLRYAQAMTIAGNPGAERREYYKKLYKLISPPEGDPALDLFARFATGAISSEELKKTWAEKALEKDAPELTQKGEWVVVNTATGKPVEGQSYNGYTRQEVYDRAKQKLSPASSDTDFKQSYEIMPQNTGKWEIYSKDEATGEEKTLEIVDGERRGEAVDKVYDKYSDQNIPFFARPYYGDQPSTPEPELSKRGKLAQRIKSAPPEQPQMWQVINKRTGEIIDDAVRGTKSGLGKYLRNYEKEHNIPQGDVILKLAAEQPGTDGDNQASDWEAVYKPTGRVVDTLSHADAEQAHEWRQSVIRNHGFDNPSDIEVRRAGEQQTYSSYADAQRAADQQNHGQQQGEQEVDGTGEPVWEIYDIGSGHVVQAFSAADQQSANEELQSYLNDWGTDDDVRDSYAVRPKMRQASVQDVEPDVAQNFSGSPFSNTTLSLNPNPTLPIENQVRMPNGVPVWELFDRSTNNNIHRIADHTMREAWSQAQQWLRNMGAEDPETFFERFGVRPVMLQPGEQNIGGAQTPATSGGPQHNYEIYMRRFPQSPIRQFRANNDDEAEQELNRYLRTDAGGSPSEYAVRPIAQNESRIAHRVFADFDNYFESIVAPVKKRLK